MFVYAITNTANGRVYVGKSVMPAARWTQHKSDSRKGVAPLYRAMRKHGIGAFEFAVVEECPSEAASYDAEQRWIAQLNSTTQGHGYNQTAGGRGNFRPCPETRARMSAAKQGKTMSAESVARRAESNRGKKRTAEQRQHLAQSDHKYRHITPAMCWELYSQGMSCADVAKQLGVKSGQPIYRLLRIGGYEIRSPGRARLASITAEQCWSLYSRGLSLRRVAAELGCNSMLVTRRLSAAGYQLRNAVQSHLRLVGKGQ